MLTQGKRTERSSEESAGSVRPLTENHDLRCLLIHGLLVSDLNVFICLHEGAPCFFFSVEVKVTNNMTESHMHAQCFGLEFFFC